MNLSEILDVELPNLKPTDANTQVVVIPDVSGRSNNTIDQDATDARNNVRQLIAQGTQAVSELLSLARDLKTPRAYEVASGMIKAMAELNHDLMEVHKRELELTQPDDAPADSGDIHIGQAVFVGSTSDLSELVKQRRAQRNANTIQVKAETVTVVQDIAGGAEVLPQKSTT